MHNDIECRQAISWNNMRLLDPMSITLRILIDTNREPENFLKTNAFYDSKIVGKCPGAKGPYDRVVVRWQHLAFSRHSDSEGTARIVILTWHTQPSTKHGRQRMLRRVTTYYSNISNDSWGLQACLGFLRWGALQVNRVSPNLFSNHAQQDLSKSL